MVPVAITRELRNHYLYWFICLYCSHSANKVLNIPSRGSFNSPAFINFLLAFSQLSILCSSILWRDGLCWLVFINSTTSLYLAIHRSSCVIVSRHVSLWFSTGLISLHRFLFSLYHLHQLRQHPFYLRTLNHAIPVEFHIVQYLILPLPSPTSPTWGTHPTRNSPRIGLGYHRACL